MEKKGITTHESSNLIAAILMSVIIVMAAVLTPGCGGPQKKNFLGFSRTFKLAWKCLDPSLGRQFFMSDATLWSMQNILMESFQKCWGGRGWCCSSRVLVGP